MAELLQTFETRTPELTGDIMTVTNEIEALLVAAGYDIVERNDTKPWGAYLRINNDQADAFVAEFFEGLTPEEARFGIKDAELSPKILVVSPGQRLSLQTHDRRAERWRFLTEGGYYKSDSLDGGELKHATKGEVVQFTKGETHRLCGNDEGFVVVAEIWQHSDPDNPSDEDDIVRLEDDYQR